MAALTLDKPYLPPVVETAVLIPLVHTRTVRFFGIVVTFTRTVW